MGYAPAQSWADRGERHSTLSHQAKENSDHCCTLRSAKGKEKAVGKHLPPKPPAMDYAYANPEFISVVFGSSGAVSSK